MTTTKTQPKSPLYSILATTLLGLILGACGVGGPGDQQKDAAVQDSTANQHDSMVQDGTTEPDAYVKPVVQSIDASTLRHVQLPQQGAGQTYLDLREPPEFIQGHIPHSKNIKLSDLWDGSALTSDAASLLMDATIAEDMPLFFYGKAADQSTIQSIAQAAIDDLGYTDVWVLNGGMEAWRAKHYYEDIEMSAILSDHYGPIPTDEYIIDAMDTTAYAQGHIAGAYNIDGDDATNVFNVADGTWKNDGQPLIDVVTCNAKAIIFYCVNPGCGVSEAEAGATEQIGCLSGAKIFHFAGGTEAWQNAGHPIACGTDPNGSCN
ncbi:MAG: hypothetical protein J7M25_04335 [Deltaproteobacteria bacterium]|nr:hypothetical protein [Deltaproteobacteria bacterium]